MHGADPVALISEPFWRTQFGESKAVLGQRLTLNGKPFTVIGVTSGGLRLPPGEKDRVDVWTPIGPDATDFLGACVVRLRAGVRTIDVERELDSLSVRSGHPLKVGSEMFTAKLAEPGAIRGYRQSLYLLAGAVALLLLVACANVPHLMLARSATREREIAIRAALGAGKLRLARQLLTESLLLSLAGCICGVLLGIGGVRALLALRPASLDALDQTRMDPHALIVALILSAAAGVVFGLTATLHSLRHSASDSLRTTALNGTANQTTHRARSVLVVSEMALSALLLVSAALLVRSVQNLEHVDTHFDTSDLYSMRIPLIPTRYPSTESRHALIDAIIDRVRRLPSVAQVTYASSTPANSGYMISRLETADDRSLPPGMMAAYNNVTPEYFDVLRLRLESGRTFSPNASSDNEILVNEGLAKRLWPGDDAIGKRLRFASADPEKPQPWQTVVGVVPNIPAHGLSSDPSDPMFYTSNLKSSFMGAVQIVVRARPGANPAADLRRAAMTVDPRSAPPSVQGVATALEDSIASQRFTMTLIAAFAILAVVLSAIGLYGVISYVVTQRTREIGIRMALGALPAEVARTVVARGLALSVVGLSLGLIAAVWGTKLIKSALFGVTGTDATSYAMTGIALLMVSILASYVPMRRAMRVDPVIAMRGD